MFTYTTLNILVYVETFNTCRHYGNHQHPYQKVVYFKFILLSILK